MLCTEIQKSIYKAWGLTRTSESKLEVQKQQLCQMATRLYVAGICI